ncbi:MAG: archaeal proteasome endopeptidase complex subunit alpha [Candidatus Hodarchaeota archaeon]
MFRGVGDRSMAYDRSTVIFSPQGDIIQLEYARKAVEKGATGLGVRTKEFVVLAGIRKETELIEAPEKIHKLDNHIATTAAGLQADTSALVKRARIQAQIHRLTYGEEITISTIANQLGEFLQQHTQMGGLRPFGTQLLFGGKLGEGKSELVLVDPGGAVFKCRAVAIGQNNDPANEILKKEYTSDMDRETAIKLVKKALESSIVNAEQEKIEIAIIDDSGVQMGIK